MYKTGDYIVYQKDVCKIKEMKEKYLKDMDYYVLEPVSDPSLKLNIPVLNNTIRTLLTKEEVKDLIQNIPSIETLDIEEKNIETEYKKLLNNNRHKDLIKIIKTTYLRNQERLNHKRKVSDKDKMYFELAEKYLYTEFSIVLNMTLEDTKNYVIQEVEKGLIHE